MSLNFDQLLNIVLFLSLVKIYRAVYQILKLNFGTMNLGCRNLKDSFCNFLQNFIHLYVRLWTLNTWYMEEPPKMHIIYLKQLKLHSAYPLLKMHYWGTVTLRKLFCLIHQLFRYLSIFLMLKKLHTVYTISEERILALFEARPWDLFH